MVHYYFYILQYAQGGRFNYIYGGDINDGSSTNDLIYVPTTTEIATISGGPSRWGIRQVYQSR
jgi:hypothetical protein